jgi:hypothetical protein
VERLTWKAESRTVMARTREWKLILDETRPAELYRMDGGWTEKENVAGRKEFTGIRKKLERRVQTTWKW